MRLYRGLTKEGKIWVYGDLVHNFNFEPQGNLRECTIVFDNDYVEVIPETVGQQVGLKDKNGTEIYEGDILQLVYETLMLRGIVQQTESGEWELYKDEGNHVGVHHNIDRVTVVGNIHQKPELLEKEK